MKEFWNARYKEEAYAYGEEPNVFLAQQLEKMPAGNILFPCEGEGRNAVFAASLGFVVLAFDSSETGKEKALKLAGKKHVEIDYQIADANEIDYPTHSFDVIALIYAHFPPEIRNVVHTKMIGWLKPGGRIILEVFNPLQLNNSSGGPKMISHLYTKEIIDEDFGSLETMMLEEAHITLSEGKYHIGEADVIRYVGQKSM